MACSPSGWGTPPTPAQTIGLLVPVPVIATWRRRRRVIISRPTIKLFGQADELGSLVSLLRGRSPLYARGLAMLGRLLADGTGPAYVGRPEALATCIREVRRALAG